MRLQSIELTNFRQFKDEKIQFAIDKNQNVTLIMGDNGSGKTSLAQAFFWCFYGTNSFQDKILLNRLVANNMIPNQKEMVCVRVYLEHKQEEYCIVRQQEYTKQYNDSLKPQNSILAISKKDKNGNRMWLGTGKTESLKNIELTNTINDIMPQDLSKYFFFDGEKIETLSKEISSGRKSNNFVEAVNSLTGLKATRNALNHLNPKLKGSVIGKLEDEYIGGSDRKIAELTEEIKRLKSEWQSADDDINSADESIKSNDLYIEELENKIKTYAEAENLQRTKTIRQNELKEHKWRKYQLLSRIYDNLNRDNLFDRFICEWPVKEALVILSNSDVSGKDIPKLHGDTIKYLLKQKQCICGTILEENSKEWKVLENLINYLPPESISTSIGNFIKRMKDKYQEKVYLLNDARSDFASILTLDEQISQCLEEIDEIDKKLNGKDVSREVNRLNKLISTTKINTVQLRNNKSALEKRIGGFSVSIQSKETERDTLAKKSSQNASIALAKKYAEALYDKFNVEYTAKEIKTKANLQAYINENFKKFFNGSITLQIDDNYAVKVSVNDKFNSLETSTAQGIAVIFAFLAAIIRIAKENSANETYPVVMDAPLSTLDNQRIKIVCDTLPQIADQVIIFIKDTDGKVAEQYFGNAIGRRLTFDKISDYLTEIK
ncbi:AAA family ATPase [Phascolarctobacterium succinatutens]|jgi:DNA sulfur modification protein DndD|uniref:AAA family ATPase n=1 Tax=Phascolarctobacterium succinatutens TaxID=626940 RepID=UPI0023F6B446|nr:AAA family ATPase [Phascolarctobacterium succinatutens]